MDYFDWLMYIDAMFWLVDVYWCYVLIGWCILMLYYDWLMYIDAMFWLVDVYWCYVL